MQIHIEIPTEKIKAVVAGLRNFKAYTGAAAWALTGEEKIGGVEGTLAVLKRLTPRSTEGREHLSDAWTRKAELDGRGVLEKIIIQNTHPKADPLLKWLEYGTKPHIIRGNPILHFFLKDGTEIFCRFVHHPGTKPYYMVKTARNMLETELNTIQHAVLQRLITELEVGTLNG